MRSIARFALMNEGSEAIAHWLERKRRTDRTWATVICVFTLSCGAAAFLLTTLVIYAVLRVISFASDYSEILSEVIALGIATGSYARIMKRRRHALDLELDALVIWI